MSFAPQLVDRQVVAPLFIAYTSNVMGSIARALDENLYHLDTENVVFFKTQAGIADDEEL